jgi:hypothetical protein
MVSWIVGVPLLGIARNGPRQNWADARTVGTGVGVLVLVGVLVGVEVGVGVRVGCLAMKGRWLSGGSGVSLGVGVGSVAEGSVVAVSVGVGPSGVRPAAEEARGLPAPARIASAARAMMATKSAPLPKFFTRPLLALIILPIFKRLKPNQYSCPTRFLFARQ